jgi:hypothetical protein
MLVAYLLLVLSGLVITVRAARQGIGRLLLAAAGTMLSLLAILTGFSIGPLVAAAAAVLLAIAGTPSKHRDHVT